MNPMLAHVWKGQDLTGWLISEKLDGIRALWYPLGEDWVLSTRQGHRIVAPSWWLDGLPKIVLDGELWGLGLTFEQVSGCCRRLDGSGILWDRIMFMAFDLPADHAKFSYRVKSLQLLCTNTLSPVPQTPCEGPAHVEKLLHDVLARGGEGLIAKHPDAPYVEKRSKMMLKIKPEYTGEATVIAYQDGRGKHEGKLGAYIVRWERKVFEIGTGLSDSERENPLPEGSQVRFSHFGLLSNGKPRHAVFRGAIL